MPEPQSGVLTASPIPPFHTCINIIIKDFILQYINKKRDQSLFNYSLKTIYNNQFVAQSPYFYQQDTLFLIIYSY